MSLYSIQNLQKYYDGRKVLDIHALEIQPHRVYSLSGPNGAGKTTFLKIIAFLMPPTRGQISFDGRPVGFQEKNLGKLRKSVVLVDQHPILFSTTVYQNIEFGLKVRKISKDRRAKIIMEALELVDMTAFMHRDARNLSGGETRRVAMARALACSPSVLLLDEPTADLDVESRLTIETIIRDIHRTRPITIIFCTHDLSQASRLTSCNIYFLNGQIHDFYHENIFTGERIIGADGRHYCRICEKLLIPIPPTDKSKIKIAIHPNSIRLNAPGQTTPPARTWAGKIIRLGAEKHKIQAVIDMGIPITAIMDIHQYECSGIRINTPVEVLFDHNGVTLL